MVVFNKMDLISKKLIQSNKIFLFGFANPESENLYNRFTPSAHIFANSVFPPHSGSISYTEFELSKEKPKFSAGFEGVPIAVWYCGWVELEEAKEIKLDNHKYVLSGLPGPARSLMLPLLALLRSKYVYLF